MDQLTMAILQAVKPGEVFARGIVANNPDGIYMTNSNLNRNMLWVAKRGQIADWAIYLHWEDMGEAYVIASGDKLKGKADIQRLVPCDDEAFIAYRY